MKQEDRNMGLKDDLKRAAYSTVPQHIELNRSLTIEELYELLDRHKDEFPMPFKLTKVLGKRIVFKREPNLEMQLHVSVKDNTITVRPVLQETSVGAGNFSIKTTTFKNGFGLATSLNRDDYVKAVVEKITRIVNG